MSTKTSESENFWDFGVFAMTLLFLQRKIAGPTGKDFVDKSFVRIFISILTGCF